MIPTDRRTRLPADGTRGPDNVSPIWYEDQQPVATSQQKKRHSPAYYPPLGDEGGKKTTRPYGYLEPGNPLIPLAAPPSSGPVPAIKFDHPLPKRGLDRHPGPIVPNPSLSQNFQGEGKQNCLSQPMWLRFGVYQPLPKP